MIAILTQQQKDILSGMLIAESWICNPIQDIDNNWVISDNEINGCTNPELQWIKNLELSIYKPKNIINPFS